MIQSTGRGLESAGRAMEPAVRAMEPAVRAMEPARRALEPAGRPGASWEGQLTFPGGVEEKREKEQSVPGTWWYHMSSSSTGPLLKKHKLPCFLCVFFVCDGGTD